MPRKTPNPYGKKGKKDHQNKILQIYNGLLEKMFRVKREGRIKTTKSKSRYADVIGFDEDNNLVEIHQVGRTNKNGTPVARERRVMAEIENATGIKVIFHPLTIILLLATAAFLWFI